MSALTMPPTTNLMRKHLSNPALTATIRSLPWTYFHLSLISTSSSAPPKIDAITARTYLNTALQQLLGLTGIAVSIDILNVEHRDVWLRVPAEDGRAVVEAVSGWVGNDIRWRIIGRGEWLGGIVAGGGADLF